MNIIYSNQYIILLIRIDKNFHIRKLYFSTIVDKVYCIYNLKLNVRGDIDMKDVVLNEVKEMEKEFNRRENFIKVLTKICLDFKIYNYKEEIKNFLEK